MERLQVIHFCWNRTHARFVKEYVGEKEHATRREKRKSLLCVIPHSFFFSLEKTKQFYYITSLLFFFKLFLRLTNSFDTICHAYSHLSFYKIRVKFSVNEKYLTCALRGGYVRTSLVFEEESAVVRTGVDVARWIRARAMATVVGKGHGAAERARYGGCLLAEHRIQQRIPRNIRAERRQRVPTVAKSCKRKLIEIKRASRPRYLVCARFTMCINNKSYIRRYFINPRPKFTWNVHVIRKCDIARMKTAALRVTEVGIC